MLHLLKIEWLKIKNYRTFWIIFILYLVSIIGINYLVYEWLQFYFEETVRRNPKDMVIKMLIGTPPYEFPHVWQMASQVASYLLIIPGLLTIILLTNEYSYKTHRQNVIDGHTRTQFVTSKLLLVIIFSIISTLVIGLTAIIFGAVTGTPFDTEKVWYLALAFLQSLNYCFFAVLISVALKRSGISIGVYFLYVVIFDNILFWVFYKYLARSGFFLPVETADGLISAPVFGELQKELIRPQFEYILGSCILYVLLYVILSYRKFQTDDL